MGRDVLGPKLPVMLPTASLFKLPVSAAGPWLSRTVLGEGRDVGLLVVGGGPSEGLLRGFRWILVCD